MNPKVSINLCCYNSEKYLRETVESIVTQTYKDWELIIINDGSSDSTEAIIYEYIKQGYLIIYYYQENKGLANSRNEALKRSKGEYIAFIDHDDIWLPGKLEKQIGLLENDQDISLVYSNYFWFNAKNTRKLVLKGSQSTGYVFEKFLYNYPVGILTAIIRRSSLDCLSGGFFDKNLNLCEEYDIFMRLAYKHKADYINEPLALYRIHQDMCSVKYRSKDPDETKYVLDKLLSLYPEIKDRYPDALAHLNAHINIYYAKIELLNGNSAKARRIFSDYKLLNLKTTVIFIFTFFPPKVFKVFVNLRRGFQFYH